MRSSDGESRGPFTAVWSKIPLVLFALGAMKISPTAVYSLREAGDGNFEATRVVLSFHSSSRFRTFYFFMFLFSSFGLVVVVFGFAWQPGKQQCYEGNGSG